MKKIIYSFVFTCLLTSVTHGQLMTSKMIGKGAANFGLGYGLFSYLDFPLTNENESFRIELMDLAFFPTKGENIFTSTAESRGYISIKLGYKYVFSETQGGFYLIPSAGYSRVVFSKEGQDATYGDGIAAALEGGYTFLVGQKSNTINLGLKYEYDRGNSTHTIQSIGFRVSYGFGLFRKKDR